MCSLRMTQSDQPERAASFSYSRECQTIISATWSSRSPDDDLFRTANLSGGHLSSECLRFYGGLYCLWNTHPSTLYSSFEVTGKTGVMCILNNVCPRNISPFTEIEVFLYQTTLQKLNFKNIERPSFQEHCRIFCLIKNIFQ